MNTMHLFNRAIANAGPLNDQQRKAIFAKGGGPSHGTAGGSGNSGRGSAALDQSGIGPGQIVTNPSPALKAFMEKTRGLAGSMTREGFYTTNGQFIPNPEFAAQQGQPNYSKPAPQPGMSLTPTVPGMMYPAVQPPAGTHWEYDPNGGRHPVRDGMVTPGVQPRDPGQMYVGGNPNFDERTGQYRDPSQRVGGPAPVRGQPNAPITAPKQKPITAVGSNPGSVGGRVGVPAPLPGGGDQRVVPGRGFPGGPPLLPAVVSAPGQTWAVGQPGRPLVRGPGGAVSEMEWTQTQGPLGYSRMKAGTLSPNANDAEKARYADIQQGRVGQMTSGGYFMADGSGFVAAPSRTQQRAASLADLLKRARGS